MTAIKRIIGLVIIGFGFLDLLSTIYVINGLFFLQDLEVDNPMLITTMRLVVSIGIIGVGYFFFLRQKKIKLETQH